MQNHSDTFQPPEQGQQPDAKQMFGFISGIFLIAVYTMSVFWAFVIRKTGSIGTRAYVMDFFFGMIVLLALRQNSWHPDAELFTATLLIMPCLYLWHLTSTVARKDHVHTQCVGSPWFPGEHGEVWEWVAGVCLGVLCFVFGAEAYGIFIITTATALAIRVGMIEERDRLRSVQMDDALWEQDYMMRNYERLKKGKR